MTNTMWEFIIIIMAIMMIKRAGGRREGIGGREGERGGEVEEV